MLPGARFFAAHGQRALVSGYTGKGLEIWAYPVQVARNYRVSFRPRGAADFLAGDTLLARVDVHPERIVRVYLGPGFVVRETLFVPLDRPGAILSYKVDSGGPIEIAVHAEPVLDLMWPGALGGQSLSWDAALKAYRIAEPAHGWSALLGSPQAAGHDAPLNRTQGGAFAQGMGLVLQPDARGAADVYVALHAPGSSGADAAYQELARDRDALEEQAAAHYEDFARSTLRITTPDAAVNAALADAKTALEQSWVCSPELGCGLVAGYGPARDARRPQYDWFFAGDGLIGADALLTAGDAAGTRCELEFVLRYQDAKTGMIWHEMSQSAPYIDWVHAYPYMYVHVDITFQFLAAAARYAAASGDSEFVKQHWAGIAAAYRYCRALLDERDGLPRIPGDKEGGNEQDRLTDELSLSSAWVAAADGYAQLAGVAGDASGAADATVQARRARAAIVARYWDERQRFWISGYTAGGAAAAERRSAAADPTVLDLLDAPRKDAVLDELAGSDFQSDWGTRGISAGSPNYRPDSYAEGSVFALNTAATASTFWSEHRPVSAFEAWRALVPWFALDSPGHMHEVLAGDVYRPGAESVPEQMWSSAGFLESAVRGLLGLRVAAAERRIGFAPHLPAAWNEIAVDQVRLGEHAVALHLRRTASGLALSVENSGPALHLDFSPQVPLGAAIVRATLNRVPARAALEEHGDDAHAAMHLELPQGASEVVVELRGGVEVVAPVPTPVPGEASVALHLVRAQRRGDRLTLVVDHLAGRPAELELHTAETISGVDGAAVKPHGSSVQAVLFAPDAGEPRADGYRRATAVFRLAPQR